jgi:hypothetical protein
MNTLDALSLPVLDLAAGTVTMSVWVAGGLLLVLLVVALVRGGAGRVVASLAFIALVGGAVAGAAVLMNKSDRVEERRALDRRLAELTAREIAPGSVLACLNSDLGEAVEGSCEKVLFAGPETVAAASSFVNARLTLLADGLEFAARTDPAYENTLAGVRRAIEADRFGFVAQVLALRDGCTAAKCDPFQWMRDATRIRANLNDRTFEGVVARNAANWPNRARAGTPVATASPPPAGTPVTGITFPSAASIPPVSIMNNEPGATAATPPQPPSAASPPAARRAAPQPRPAQPRTNQGTAPVQISPNQNAGASSRPQQPQQP